MGGLIAQFPDRIPASALLGRNDAVLDQPLDAPVEVGPTQLPVLGVALLVWRAASLLVAVQDRGIGNAPQLVFSERIQRVVEPAVEQDAAGDLPHISDLGGHRGG